MRASANGSVPQPWKAQLERKLAQGAGLALSDCFVGLRAMCVLYFGISALLLASIPLDWLCGTSLTHIWADWYIEIKLTQLAAALLWVHLLSCAGRRLRLAAERKAREIFLARAAHYRRVGAQCDAVRRLRGLAPHTAASPLTTRIYRAADGHIWAEARHSQA